MTLRFSSNVQILLFFSASNVDISHPYTWTLLAESKYAVFQPDVNKSYKKKDTPRFFIMSTKKDHLLSKATRYYGRQRRMSCDRNDKFSSRGCVSVALRENDGQSFINFCRLVCTDEYRSPISHLPFLIQLPIDRVWQTKRLLFQQIVLQQAYTNVRICTYMHIHADTHERIQIYPHRHTHGHAH